MLIHLETTGSSDDNAICVVCLFTFLRYGAKTKEKIIAFFHDSLDTISA